MIYDRVLIRYGDLTLKGKNQKVFLNSVYKLTVLKLKGLDVLIEKTYNRLYVVLNDCDPQLVINALDHVSGLKSYSLVIKCTNDINIIFKTAIDLINEEVCKKVTFKVEAKRANKRFPIGSQELAKVVANYVLQRTDKLIVDVHNPEVVLFVEVREEGTYLYLGEKEGMGGFPVGIAGKGLLMMSGGIDSPVAGYLSMKQGVEVEVLHFESTPLTSIESAQKVIDLSEKLAYYAPNNRILVHMVPFMEMHKNIIDNIPDSYNITIMRRMMYRIASEFIKKRNILIIINGESIGQVASQTLTSMRVINEVTNDVVIRPLSTFDKNDIIKIARRIDTFNISIKPFEDCCTVYVPKNPVINPRLDKCIDFENNFDYVKLVNECVENIKTFNIKINNEIDLPLIGLEVRKC